MRGTHLTLSEISLQPQLSHIHTFKDQIEKGMNWSLSPADLLKSSVFSQYNNKPNVYQSDCEWVEDAYIV